MRDELAERLLANVMNWSPADVARERPRLQSLAAFKYDEYQQFSPGLRFVESLARWLQQFEPTERSIAYSFVLSRLIFVSAAEMTHLVSTVFADVVQPYLIRRVAEGLGVEPWRVTEIVASRGYRLRERRTLFLGLSDGARLDVFRRSARTLSNEQVYATYEIPAERALSLSEDLRKDLDRNEASDIANTFETIILLDDFAGTGSTYKAKLHRIVERLTTDGNPMKELVSPASEIVAVVYLATERAADALRRAAAELATRMAIRVEIVHVLPASVSVTPDSEPFSMIVEKYLDWEQDSHFAKGGTKDARYGYGGCGLPLVLTHNTPNDSFFLLWTMKKKLRGLFPRVDRHKDTT